MAAKITTLGNGLNSLVLMEGSDASWHGNDEFADGLKAASKLIDLPNINYYNVQSGDLIDGSFVGNGTHSVYCIDKTGAMPIRKRLISGMTQPQQLIQPQEIVDQMQCLVDEVGLKFVSLGLTDGGREFWVQLGLGNFSLQSNANEIFKNKLAVLQQYGQYAVSRKIVEHSTRVVCSNTFGIVFGGENSVDFRGNNQLLLLEGMVSIYQSAMTAQRNFSAWLDDVYNTYVPVNSDDVTNFFAKVYAPQETTTAVEDHTLARLATEYKSSLSREAEAEFMRRAENQTAIKKHEVVRAARAINESEKKYDQYKEELPDASPLYWLLQAVTDVESNGVNDGGRKWERGTGTDIAVRKLFSDWGNVEKAKAMVVEMM